MKIKIYTSALLLVALILTSSQAAERPAKKAFKGFELYSWCNSEGSWVFALLLGTNRLKTEPEIKKRENRISGIRELEEGFSNLAEGENVSWFNSDAPGFEFPDDSIINEIKLSARKAKIGLHLHPKLMRKS